MALARNSNRMSTFRSLPADRGIPGFGSNVNRLISRVRSLGLGGSYAGGHPLPASLVTALTGTNNDLKFTAVVPGADGNSIRVRYVVAGASTPLSVAVAGNDITVNVATNGSSAATSTAAQVRDAVNANTAAARLVSAANETGNDGTGVVTALAYTALSGGASLKRYADAPST